jgi:EmrB/QacA subfamily drug resistance transporter
MPTANRWAALAVLCLAVITINVATTITNIALPTLVDELDASTTDLLWIVDAFNLAFAALVLAAGSLSDRFGRKEALLGGLALYVVASLAGAFATTSGQLIATRAVAGVAAAVIFPTTLSIIANVFADRAERARAIGLWGASTGLAVAVGPIVGGALLETWWWGATLLFCAGLGTLALVLTLRLVPTSRDPSTPPLDVRGLVLSTMALGLLIHTIIQAPERGWGSATTLAAFAVTAVLLAVFVAVERRVRIPMLDVRLFTNLRFTAASAAVTFAFFALFGFIFLITQYFQFVKDYGPLEAGLRQLPVALSVAATSVTGAVLAVRVGTKAVVTGGLLLLTAAYAWISTGSAETSYLEIAGQMVLLGSGMGLTSAPATEAIMGVVPAAKAGIGSAVNDATRELGGTLGVAVIGSVALSLYRDAIDGAGLPAPVTEQAQESVGAAYAIAGRTGDGALVQTAQQGFLDGLQAGCLVAAGVALVGALLVAMWLPSHPTAAAESPAGQPATSPAAA